MHEATTENRHHSSGQHVIAIHKTNFLTKTNTNLINQILLPCRICILRISEMVKKIHNTDFELKLSKYKLMYYHIEIFWYSQKGHNYNNKLKLKYMWERWHLKKKKLSSLQISYIQLIRFNCLQNSGHWQLHLYANRGEVLLQLALTVISPLLVVFI